MTSRPPPPPPPPSITSKESAPTKKKWAPVDVSPKTVGFADGNLGEVDLTRPSVRVLDDVDWSGVAGLTRAEGLMVSPVAFLAAPSGLLVIKAGKGMAQEYFGSLLAPLCGAKVPRCRVVLTSSDAFAALNGALSKLWHDAVERSLARMDFPTDEQRAECRAHVKWSESYFQRRFGHAQRAMLTFEYVPRIAPSEMKLSREALADVGALVILDLLLVNKDRFPLFTCAEDANLGNTIVRASDGAVVGIDQAATALGGESARDAARAKLRDLLDDLGTVSAQLVSLLISYGFSLVDGEGEAAAAECLADAVRAAAVHVVRSIDSRDTLDSLKRSVESEFCADRVSEPDVAERLRRDLEQIDTAFIWQIVQDLDRACNFA